MYYYSKLHDIYMLVLLYMQWRDANSHASTRTASWWWLVKIYKDCIDIRLTVMHAPVINGEVTNEMHQPADRRVINYWKRASTLFCLIEHNMSSLTTPSYS